MMSFKLIIFSVLLLLGAVIALLNTEQTVMNFLFFSVHAPLIVMIVVIFILGLVAGFVFASLNERKKRIVAKKDDSVEKQ
jgi:uncharacterized integral membrane protein